ncbi:MAG: YibE/F family protein [Propionibacteriaceae bacterium]|nr:YibE/F family protein [Propionibacteriaceae bacterium]
MGAGHDHGPPPDIGISRVARIASTVLLAIVAVVTVVGVVLLWPGERQTIAQAAPGTASSVAAIEKGRVVGMGPCEAIDGSFEIDESIQHECAVADVLIGTGPSAGETVRVELIGVSAMSGLVPGDSVHVSDIGGETGSYWSLIVIDRLMPLLWFTTAFVVVVIAVAGWKGVRGLIGLVVAGAVFFMFMLPALATGRPPVAVALVGGAAIMFAVLYLAHGISMRTTSAFVGTLVSLLATAGLGALGVWSARLSGLSTDETIALAGQSEGMSFTALLTCSLIIAGLGVLNDTTITQSSAVWELRAAGPHLTRWQLFSSGMRIGRDHIASTIYTIVFAYAGAALSTLVLLALYTQPLGLLLSTEMFAEEIVRTLGSGIGLVLSVPLTTAVAALTVAGASSARAELAHDDAHGHGHAHADAHEPEHRPRRALP